MQIYNFFLFFAHFIQKKISIFTKYYSRPTIDGHHQSCSQSDGITILYH